MKCTTVKIGDKIQALRKNNSMSQEDLAAELKINRNCLSRIETGKSEPSIAVVKNISKLFDIDISSLIDMDEEKKSNSEKIKTIAEGCKFLNENDLDFVIRLVSVLRAECVKKNID